MLNTNKPLQVHQYEFAAAESNPGVELNRLLLIVKRGRWIILATTVFTLALAGAYLALETPLYRATSEIIIDTITSKMMQNQNVGDASNAGADVIDSNLVDSEVQVLSSDGFARKIVRELDLTQDPEFVGPPDRLGQKILYWLQGLAQTAKAAVGLHSNEIDDPEQRAATAFSKRLSIKRDALTYVIGIDFFSEDRVKAARIANAVADTYLKTVLDAKYAAARQTGQWIREHLAEMRGQANADDRAVEIFKAQNNIVDTNRGLMSEQQLSDVNSQLTVAKAATAEAKAKLDRVRAILADPTSSSTVSDALSNPVIARLRAQYLDLAARAGDLASRLGPDHSTVTQIKNQMEQVKKAIQAELGRIADAYDSDYRIAQAREVSLQASLNGMVSDNAPTNLAQAKLRDLESSAETSRALLNGYLQKFQAANELETFPISDARVITQASSPLKPDNPKAWFVLAAGLAGGLLLGAGVVFAREQFNNSFRTGDDLQSYTGLRFLGVLPKVYPKKRRAGRSAGSEPAAGEPRLFGPVDSYVLEAPFSRFAETFRGIRVAIDGIDQEEGLARVVGVVSAAPHEGKTTVAANLAQKLATTGGRTLLIDCDVRTRALTARLSVKSHVGLLQALADLSVLPSALLKDEGANLHVLPCVRAGESLARDAELLGAEKMAALLKGLRKFYKYIVLDIAPVVPVVDARALAPLVDCFILVVKWAETDRRMVGEAVTMEGVQPRLLGVVLNQVDSQTIRELESYRGKGFYRYYLESR